MLSNVKDSKVSEIPTPKALRSKQTSVIEETTVLPDRPGSPALSVGSCEDAYDSLNKYQAAQRFFSSLCRVDEDRLLLTDFLKSLKTFGFQEDDPRFKNLYTHVHDRIHDGRDALTLDEFVHLLVKSEQSVLLERAFRHDLVIPEFDTFCKDVTEIFRQVQKTIPATHGKPADYIPQLGRVDPNLFGIAICTIDGQRYCIGDQPNYSVQSCVKPFNYCFAMEENGCDKVHDHIGREPSGVKFNSLCLNSRNLPHNAMINAGAIMACSLIRPEEKSFTRFDHVTDSLSRLSGGKKWGFSNSVYLSEKETADSNFCLSYMMRGKGVFPCNTDLQETLDFYFQCCSLETNTTTMAIAGATLANGGVCPLTGERVLQTQTVRDCLSVMFSCGMYDYSGEWAFKVGIPAKSGVSGCIFAVIPDFGCICVYAPPLDDIGNSVRGVEFFRLLGEHYSFHNFDCATLSIEQGGKKNPRRNHKTTERESRIHALYAAAEGDLSELRRLLLAGVSPMIADYDGRTLLHLAASEGHTSICRYLVRKYDCDIEAKDRWGGTPLTDAIKAGHQDIVVYFEKQLKNTQNLTR